MIIEYDENLKKKEVYNKTKKSKMIIYFVNLFFFLENGRRISSLQIKFVKFILKKKKKNFF